MLHLIDRRLNPRDKSLGNRQRFLRRAREQIKRAVDKAVNERGVVDAGDGGKVSIPSRGIGEPRFRHGDTSGHRERVFPGNKEFVPGDRISKPPKGGGEGAGKEGSDDGEGSDDFVFTLSRNEFLDLLFDDLELPDLIKSSIKETYASKPRRAGYSSYGTASNLNVLRTMRNSIGRRLVLRRPAESKLNELKAELAELQGKRELDTTEQLHVIRLSVEIEEMERRRRAIPYIDPMDIRYNRFENQPAPRTKAVMFCLMDVSGSMGQHEKDLAKRFFVLLHLFLMRKYERVEIVFIRHTHRAQEVDEDTFFYSQESGGTVVSTALTEMDQIIQDRYPVSEWNIYGAQASDGDNFSNDTSNCIQLLNDNVLPVCQYYAYVEILTEHEAALTSSSDGGKELWRGYRTVGEQWQNFSMKHVSKRSEIYPVFRELFEKRE